MIYPYRCDSCAKDFDVVKSHLQMNDPEKCECGSGATRQFTARVHIMGASVQNAEYNPGLGCVVRNKEHRAEIAKRKGMVEIGNDYRSGDAMGKQFDTEREAKLQRRRDTALD